MATPALLVDQLSVEFRTRSGIVKALENVKFHVAKGETIAMVGESGSGKSVTAYAIMGILDSAAWPAAGLMDTKIRCFMKPEVSHAKAQVQ